MAQITTLFGVFDHIKQLIATAESHYLALQSVDAKIKKQEQELKHLQDLLTSNSSTTEEKSVEKLLVSKEQALLEDQIHILYQRSLSKELNIEEAKKLDIFLRNLNLIKGQATGIVGTTSKKFKQDMSESRLIQIASTPTLKDE